MTKYFQVTFSEEELESFLFFLSHSMRSNNPKHPQIDLSLAQWRVKAELMGIRQYPTLGTTNKP